MIPIHRVVTCFILTQKQRQQNPRVAIFHRVDTMPTFANFWAGISGTIEASDPTPLHAAQRELEEETNLLSKIEERGGLYVDVHHTSERTHKEQIIRVYPFVVHVPHDTNLELRGTEHDRYKFVTVKELEIMKDECVPGLVEAFHHATYGQYDASIRDEVKEWANDKENGASVMTLKALQLIKQQQQQSLNQKNPTNATLLLASQIAMLRPSMVPITNVMHQIIQRNKRVNNNHKEEEEAVDVVTIESFQNDIEQAVEAGQLALEELQAQKQRPLIIATFSHSGILTNIVKSISSKNGGSPIIICGRSSPGNEGELMAQHLGATCVSDATLQTQISKGAVDVLLIGADCVLQDAIVNKIGSKTLCQAASGGSSRSEVNSRSSNITSTVPVYCCADRWKIWDDIVAPPLEMDLFEVVPLNLISKLLVPGLSGKYS